MKKYCVSIHLELETKDDAVEITERRAKDDAIAYLMELIEDDSLEIEVEPWVIKQ